MICIVQLSGLKLQQPTSYVELDIHVMGLTIPECGFLIIKDDNTNECHNKETNSSHQAFENAIRAVQRTCHISGSDAGYNE